MKRISLLSFIFVLVFSLCGCGDSSLSKGKAKDIIEEHFGVSYLLCVPKKVEFTFKAPRGYKMIKVAQKVGVINAKQTSSVLGQFGMGHNLDKPAMGDTFSITLSEKGNSVPHVEDTYGDTCFLTNHNKINDIIEITKGQDKQYTVLFSYTTRNSDLAEESAKEPEEFLTEKVKYRGKATIVYDSFLKNYVLTNLELSYWDKEEWFPGPWTIMEGQKKVITYGKTLQR